MYNIDKIEIIINNINDTINVLVMPDNHKAYKDNKEIDIDDTFINRLLNNICLWDKSYVDNSIIDANSYTVKVYTKEGVDTYTGKGKYPDNYPEFLELLGDLDG